MYTIHFLSVVLKDVSVSLCNSQIVAIGVVCTIFEKYRTIEAYPTVHTKKVRYPPKSAVPLLKPLPVRYPAPTSDSFHGKERSATSKGVLKYQASVTSKGGKVPVTYKVYQEPVAARTRSWDAPPTSPLSFESRHLHFDASVSERTISHTVSSNLTNPSR